MKRFFEEDKEDRLIYKYSDEIIIISIIISIIFLLPLLFS